MKMAYFLVHKPVSNSFGRFEWWGKFHVNSVRHLFMVSLIFMVYSDKF